MGSWADGLVTVRKAPPELIRIVDRFRAGGGENKPLALQLQISWAEDEDDARMAAWEQWRSATRLPWGTTDTGGIRCRDCDCPSG